MNNISKTALVLIFVTICSQDTRAKHRYEQSSAQSGLIIGLKEQNLSSGGGVITGGNYSVTSSIAQIDAGHNATGGNYKFKGGFLHGSNDDLIYKNGFD